MEGARRVLDCMNRLWQEQKLCDVIIHAQCDQVKTHKIAHLAAYSEFLNEKFCTYPAGCLPTRYNTIMHDVYCDVCLSGTTIGNVFYNFIIKIKQK